MSNKKTLEEFKREVFNVFGGNAEVIGEYINNKTKILVKFNCCGNEEYKIPTKLLIGQGCSKCTGKRISKSKTKTTEQYKKDLLLKGIDYIEVIGQYKSSKENVYVLNKKCNHKYHTNAGNILNGSGCPICHGMKDTNDFKKEIEFKYPGEYEVLGKYVNNKTPIKVKHKCGYTWEVIPKDLLKDIRCPKCIMSKGELFINNYLTKNNIEFIPQFKFKDCKDKNPLPFDFMIKIDNEMKLIEFDGSHHFKGTKTKFRTSKVKLHDEIKNNYCKNHNIELLRIPYWWLRNDRITKELDKFILNK